MAERRTNFTDDSKKTRTVFNTDQLKRIIFFRKSIPPSEIILVKHPKQQEGWYGVHEKAKVAFEIFAEIEEVEDVPIWKVPGFEKYNPDVTKRPGYTPEK
jgi:hypothetical protein